jgi:hypothetical protein
MRDGQMNVNMLQFQLVGEDESFIEETLFVKFKKTRWHLTITVAKYQSLHPSFDMNSVVF